MTEYLYLKGEAFKNSCPQYWENGDWYNPLIKACEVLFPNNVIADNDNWTIRIRSTISLTFICSGNEGKVYVRTTQEPYQFIPIKQQDYSFRFFSYRETLGFLFKMKEVENYIIENQG